MKRLLSVCALILLITSNYSYADQIDFDRLVEAVIVCESGGNPNAVNGECVGLMQISPMTLREFNKYNARRVLEGMRNPDGSINRKGTGGYSYIDGGFLESELFVSNINKKVGSWYLHRLHEHYNCQTIEQICAAYNGGIGNLRKVDYDVAKAPASVQAYICKVTGEYRK